MDVLCRSVGVLLAVGAGAQSRGPAEGAPAASLPEGGRGSQSGGGPTWPLERGPRRQM